MNQWHKKEIVDFLVGRKLVFAVACIHQGFEDTASRQRRLTGPRTLSPLILRGRMSPAAPELVCGRAQDVDTGTGQELDQNDESYGSKKGTNYLFPTEGQQQPRARHIHGHTAQVMS